MTAEMMLQKKISPSEKEKTGNISVGERSSGLTSLYGTETDFILLFPDGKTGIR